VRPTTIGLEGPEAIRFIDGMETAIRADSDIHKVGFAGQGGTLPGVTAVRRLHDHTHATNHYYGILIPCGCLEQIGALSGLG